WRQGKCPARGSAWRQAAYSLPLYLSSFDYTRRRLGGRQPLCGMGVTSLIMVTSRPAVWRARMAASRPEPGPLTKTSTVFSPCSMAARAAVSAAVWAAKGVLFLLPRKPMPPAEAQEMALPFVSVTVTIVLLKLELICTAPRSIFFRSLRRVRTFFLGDGMTYPSLLLFVRYRALRALDRQSVV